MAENIVLDQTPAEYFREAVSEVVAHRRLQVAEETEFYLVNLLATRFAAGAVGPTEPLALILARALVAGREERFQELKRLGDTSLFVSGFFSDAVARSPVGAGYYLAMGERAYGAISAGRLAAPGRGELFAELASRFADFVDLFAEIAEMAELRSNRGLLRLYERFLHTGSERVAERLRERGVALFAGPGSRRLVN